MKFYPGFRSFDLFDDFFDDDFGLTTSSQLMKTDICEKNGNYELSMEVPGIKRRYSVGVKRWLFEDYRQS